MFQWFIFAKQDNCVPSQEATFIPMEHMLELVSSQELDPSELTYECIDPNPGVIF